MSERPTDAYYGWDEGSITFMDEPVTRGGPGSGHFEHEGRPGEVGGSLPSDALEPDVIGDIFIGVAADAEGIEIGKRQQDLNAEGIFQPSGAPIRGTVMSLDDERLPDTVFHMTSDIPGIIQSAEISARGFGGLGGDKTDQIVSMTIDEDIAKSLVHDTRLAAMISREFLLTQPDFHYVDDEWKVVDKQTGETMDSKVWSKELIDRMNEIDTAAGDWEFSWDFEFHNPKYGIKDWFRQYFMERNRATDLRNPIFFTPAEDLAAIDPDKVGYVRIPRDNLGTGALLADFDLNNPYGLQEVRLYGDVPLAGAEFILE